MLVAGTLQAQVAESPIPSIVHKDGRYALFVDGAPYLILGTEAQNLRSGEHLAVARGRVGGHGIPERQHHRNSGLLGPVRAPARGSTTMPRSTGC